MAQRIRGIAHRLHEEEQGDVPGWVLIVVMTVGLLLLVWGIASDRLSSLLDSVFDQVRNPRG